MNEAASELERAIVTAYRLSLRAEMLDVAEELLRALQQLPERCPQVEESVTEAFDDQSVQEARMRY